MDNCKQTSAGDGKTFLVHDSTMLAQEKRWRASAIGSRLAESPPVLFDNGASGRDGLAYAFLVYLCLHAAGGA